MTFTDERGTIKDILGPVDCVTRVSTVKGAVRGNHLHERTTQWTFIVSGSLRVATGRSESVWRAGEIMVHEPGTPHAWKALENTLCLVFTRGPRGEDYESDTIRLDEPLL